MKKIDEFFLRLTNAEVTSITVKSVNGEYETLMLKELKKENFNKSENSLYYTPVGDDKKRSKLLVVSYNTRYTVNNSLVYNKRKTKSNSIKLSELIKSLTSKRNKYKKIVLVGANNLYDHYTRATTFLPMLVLSNILSKTLSVALKLVNLGIESISTYKQEELEKIVNENKDTLFILDIYNCDNKLFIFKNISNVENIVLIGRHDRKYPNYLRMLEIDNEVNYIYEDKYVGNAAYRILSAYEDIIRDELTSNKEFFDIKLILGVYDRIKDTPLIMCKNTNGQYGMFIRETYRQECEKIEIRSSALLEEFDKSYSPHNCIKDTVSLFEIIKNKNLCNNRTCILKLTNYEMRVLNSRFLSKHLLIQLLKYLKSSGVKYLVNTSIDKTQYIHDVSDSKINETGVENDIYIVCYNFNFIGRLNTENIDYEEINNFIKSDLKQMKLGKNIRKSINVYDGIHNFLLMKNYNFK